MDTYHQTLEQAISVQQTMQCAIQKANTNQFSSYTANGEVSDYPIGQIFRQGI